MQRGTEHDANTRSNCKASLGIDVYDRQYRKVRGWLTDLALPTNKALALAEELIELLRSRRIIVPAITMIDGLCAEALARGVKLLYKRLTRWPDDHCGTNLMPCSCRARVYGL